MDLAQVAQRFGVDLMEYIYIYRVRLNGTAVSLL